MIPIVIKDAFKLQAHSQWVPTPGIIKIKIENPISTQIWTLQTLKLHVEEVRKIMSQSLLQ
jgi:hypothetical protein